MHQYAAPLCADQPVLFPPGEHTYFGMLSRPEADRRLGIGVVMLSGSHSGSTTIGRNRMWVAAGRLLAERGFTALRLDYGGLGESLSGASVYDLERPATDAFHRATELFQSIGIDRLIVVGTCFGSRTALCGAAEHERICGVLLLAPPVRNPQKGKGGTGHHTAYTDVRGLAKQAFSIRTMRKLASIKQARHAARVVLSGKAKSIAHRSHTQPTSQQFDAVDGFLLPLAAVLERGIPVRIIYGTDDFYWTEYQRATDGRLGRIVDAAGDQLNVETVPGVVRGFTSLRIQQRSIDAIVSFSEDCA